MLIFKRQRKFVGMNNCSAVEPDPFFWDEPDFGPEIWIESGQVGPQSKKT